MFLVSTHSGSSYHSSLPQLQVCLGKQAILFIRFMIVLSVDDAITLNDHYCLCNYFI